MKRTKLSEKPWYNGAVIACIAVAFYVLLANLGTVLSSVRFFLGNFNSIVLGAIFAYLMNPLAKFFDKKVTVLFPYFFCFKISNPLKSTFCECSTIIIPPFITCKTSS